MKEVIAYFKAERAGSLVLIGTGILLVILASWFWISVRKPFYNGMATSLIIIAVVQLIVGSVIFYRTPSDITKVETFIANFPSKLRSEELPRMENVMHRFVTYRYLEITFAMLGIALIFHFKEPSYWKGFGAGLFAQAIWMLIFDYFAENRGKVYLDFLRQFDNSK